VLLDEYRVEITEVTKSQRNSGSPVQRLIPICFPSSLPFGGGKLYNLDLMTVTVPSFAKINLGLRIGAAREDGFHELLTVYQTLALYDVIRVSAGKGSGIEIVCQDPRVPRDESNTCFRVVEKALGILGVKARVKIEIEKRLPVQGGLGGASANAVATLLALEPVLKKSLSGADRFRIAAEVGSDLPLFLVGGTVLGVGRGEHVFPLPDLPSTPCVVVTPEVGVSTPNAFAEWDRRTQGAGGAAIADELFRRKSGTAGKLTMSPMSARMNEFSRGLSAWLSELHTGAPSRFWGGRGRAGNPLPWLVRAGIENDFEQVVFPEYPELREGKRALLRAGATYASLSGSGSALYGLFRSKKAASSAALKIRKQGWTAHVTATLPRRPYWSKIFDC
jgi:4-diphosphocytidyl-2-C-methyl-D-erythritol kinase